MALKNVVTAGDYMDGEVTSKGKKGLLITVAKTLAHPLRPTLKVFVNKDTVESYEVVMDEADKSVGSGVARGAVGGALFGGIGAIAGASSGKTKSVYTVSIVFKDGKRCLCDLDGSLYKQLVQIMY